MAQEFRRAAVATAPVALAFAALAAIEISYFPGRDSRLHVTALREKAIALAELTAHSAAPALEFEDDAVLGEFLNGVARDPEVTRVVACSDAGAVLRSVGANGRVTCPHVNATEIELSQNELRVATPIAAKTNPGALLIVFKTAAIERARHDAALVALAIAGGILLLGAGVSWWLARMLLRLQALVQENRVARARAEAANQAKSAFLANMSHEIRTPMNAVIGLTELLERSELSSTQRARVRTIARSGELLLAIINDILDFSKVEAGELAIVRGPLDLRELVREACESVRETAFAKGLELHQHFDGELPELVSADGLRLRQVLLNLLSNAIKFTERGRVSVLVRPVAGSPERLRFEVTDTGVGIAVGNQARLFDAFTQVEEQSTRRYGGTGLGLAICKRLVVLMGGTLGLDSAPSAGSTFWFELPAPPAHGRREATTPSPPDTTPAKPRQTGRLLAVDDNEINRGVLEHLARTLGYEVDLVEGGREAVERVSGGQPYALVLMDCQMPEVDGYMATRQIRAWQERAGAPHLPIVAVTAHALDGEEAKVRAAGMDDYLPKPVRLESLRKMLEKWLPERARGTP